MRPFLCRKQNGPPAVRRGLLLMFQIMNFSDREIQLVDGLLRSPLSLASVRQWSM